MQRLIFTGVMTLAMIGSFGGCSTAPSTTEKRDQLVTDGQTAFQKMKTEDPSLKEFLAKAYGHAMFPSVGKGGVGIGGAYGKGVVYEGSTLVGYCSLSQATIGLQLGGQSYSELLVFENKASFDRFTGGKLEFAAQVSAVALKAGASANADYRDGVAVFTSAEAGLMYEASLGGQKFNVELLDAAKK